MNKLRVISICVLTSMTLFSQDTSKSKVSKWMLNTYFKAGQGQLQSSQYGKLNSQYWGDGITIQYDFNQNYGLSTGIEMMTLTSNPVLSGNQYYLENTYFQIPIRAVFKNKLTQNQSKSTQIRYLASLGLLSKYLGSNTLSYANVNTSNSDLGWNFAIDMSLGLDFALTERLGFVIAGTFQQDFTNTNIQGTTEKLNELFGAKFQLNIKL